MTIPGPAGIPRAQGLVPAPEAGPRLAAHQIQHATMPSATSSQKLSRRRRPLVPLLAGLLAAMASAPELQAQVSDPATPGWRMVYRHGPNGAPLAGDKAQLVDAIRRGLDIRLAWGVRHPRDEERSVEHTALPVFVTIVDEAEVFVQVAEHVAHADYWARERQGFADPRIVWAGILGTTGSFEAVWYNRATGEPVRTLPQRVAISWFVNYPAASRNEPAAPSLAPGRGDAAGTPR